MRNASHTLVPLVAAMTLAACSEEALTQLGRFRLQGLDTARAEVSFCTSPPDAYKGNTLFITIFDKSGSNQGSGGDAPTDADGARRYVPYLSFLRQMPPYNGQPADPTLHFLAINFSDAATTIHPRTNNLTGYYDFIRDDPKAFKGIGPDYLIGEPTDGDWTNYLAALSTTNAELDALHNYLKSLAEVQTYHVIIFFISDGVPKTSANFIQSTEDIVNSIKNIRSKEAHRPYFGSITLYTFYYYETLDPNARNLMQTMATEGGGEYFESSSGNAVQFDKFRVPTQHVRKKLAELFMDNLNVQWRRGELFSDDDGDGLDDLLERTLGSHPSKKDSDENGVSDAVEYHTLNKPCRDPHCSRAQAEPFAFCNQYLVNPAQPAVRVFVDPDKDGLNSCEKHLLQGLNFAKWDTNDDWIPDLLSFRRGVAYQAGVVDAWLNPDWDDLYSYQEVKALTPVDFDNRRIYGLKPQRYFLELVSDDNGRDCYEGSVEDIPVALGDSGENVGRLYLGEHTVVGDRQRILRVAEKPLVPGGTVVFHNEDFK